MTSCSNCRSRPGRALSYDLDLPVVHLCDICAPALLIDKETFDLLTAQPRRQKSASPADGAL